MADDPKRTFSEDEHLAVLEDRVKKETAELTAERDTLKTERDELANKLDVETSARQAAEQRATAAEQALETFKQEVQEKEEAAARKDERVSKVRDAAAHLKDDFFTEARVGRIVAMDEATFEGYLDDLRETAKAVPAGGDGQPPRETAMKGDEAKGEGTGAVRAGRNFLFLGTEQKGA